MLDVLAGLELFFFTITGRNKVGTVLGEVYIDGLPRPSFFRQISAYVMQDDALIGNLTVFETLMYSAALRLPSTYQEREKVVNRIIQLLGLNKVAHTRIGTQLNRGKNLINR